MFCDKTKITVKAGNGGHGCVSARREKCIPFGGPNGGDGGKGGDLIFRVNTNLNTLIDLHTKKFFFAENGEYGKGKDMHGKDGEDLVLEVPKGTLIRRLDNGEVFDLKEGGAELLLQEGGRGGYGNAHFTSSTRQFPDFAELGEPKEEIELELELQLVADVGIIGVPSAGKSSLIGKASNLRPKVGDYQFTTLVPNVGVVKVFDKSLVVTDVPGLIEGASEGRGLGHDFLRHVSRNSTLIHLVDGNSLDPTEDYLTVQKELKKYSEELFKKSQILAINKTDLLDKESNELLREQFKNLKNREFQINGIEEIYFISAVTGEGVDQLFLKASELLESKKEKTKEVKEAERVLYQPHLELDPKAFQIEKIKEEEGQVFKITGQRIEQIAKMTNFDQRGGVERLYDVLIKMKIQNKLESLAAKDGDILQFGNWPNTLTFRESLR